ncbi:MAG: CopG family transcriptional regulator [bacterium]
MNFSNLESTQNKTHKIYFWSDKELIKFIDSEAQRRGISRSAFIRWVLLNFNDSVLPQIEEIYNEIVRNKMLRKNDVKY